MTHLSKDGISIWSHVAKELSTNMAPMLELTSRGLLW